MATNPLPDTAAVTQAAAVPSAGTWHIVTDERGFPSIVWREPDETEDLVAHVFGGHEHLISAAPDLAETLKLLLTRVQMEIRNGKLPPEWGCPLISDANAALAKARGETA